jgi:hypothetical protein
MPEWGWIIVVGAAIVLSMIAHSLGWIDLSDKSRRRRGGSSGSGMFGIGDEVFNPTKHEAQVELDRQTILPAPAPLPGDGDKGVADTGPGYSGRLRIDVPSDR